MKKYNIYEWILEFKEDKLFVLEFIKVLEKVVVREKDFVQFIVKVFGIFKLSGQ